MEVLLNNLSKIFCRSKVANKGCLERPVSFPCNFWLQKCDNCKPWYVWSLTSVVSFVSMQLFKMGWINWFGTSDS